VIDWDRIRENLLDRVMDGSAAMVLTLVWIVLLVCGRP